MRLPAGGVIDRAKPITFLFDNKTYTGFAGDTLASALLANGVKLVGRSFKYHRPRGILAAGAEEPNALVEVGAGPHRTPNTRATMVQIHDGLTASSQNRSPSLKFDLLAINSVLAPFFAAGFYYKTFMWPASFWEKIYEPIIRRAAGLGRNAALPDPDSYEKSTAFCDLLVIGAGTAGCQAARAAAAAGERVIICDEQPGAALEPHSGITIIPSCTVFGVYDGNTYAALEDLAPATRPRQRYLKIIAKRSILATGAIERPMVFADNDLPGIMLAGAVQKYINRYAVAPGRRAVVFANHDGISGTLEALQSAGITLIAYIDPRREIPAPIRDLVHTLGAPIFSGAVIRRAHGRLAVESVEILASHGGVMRLACDVVATSAGWNPTVHLTSHLDGKPVWNETIAAFVPGALPPNMEVIGAAAGDGLNQNIQPIWHVPGAGKAFVDFQNDVTVTDIALARQEGFSAIEHLKRYTTLGMATDQGKTANTTAIAIMAELTGRPVAQTGTTKFRPPYTPVAIGAFAGPHRGAHFKPTRHTPTHGWAASRGAVFIETGLWLRAQYFPQIGEDWQTAVNREVNAVRNHAGICDVTTLGKIDIQGPDAAKLLDLVYTNTFSTLPIGRARYGLMLRDDGFVMDDGTTTRLAETRYVMTTTTANAAKVFQHLELCRQFLFAPLDVQITSITDQWAQLAIAGPHARATLQNIVDPGYDISNQALPYMHATELTICNGTKARLFRLSFSGELAYELAVPARYGAALAEALMQAGADFNITPYGTEALGVMRVEKGHPAGNELNGQTTAHDLGLHKLLSTKKDYIGRALSGRPVLTDPARQTLVGLRPLNIADRLRAGSHLLPQGAPATAANDQGHITSAVFSPTFDCTIALALLANGPARIGETIRVYDPIRNGDCLAEVVHPVFYDPEGARLRA